MQSYFPLRQGIEWIYCVMNPVLNVQQVVIRVGPRVEINLEDMLTGEVSKEQAWTLEQDGKHQRFAVERPDGVEIAQQHSFGKPEKRALVVHVDWRWTGDPTWSHPYWHYVLNTWSRALRSSSAILYVFTIYSM